MINVLRLTNDKCYVLHLTNDKCTPSPLCFPEHSKQIHIPYVTDTH